MLENLGLVAVVIMVASYARKATTPLSSSSSPPVACLQAFTPA